MVDIVVVCIRVVQDPGLSRLIDDIRCIINLVMAPSGLTSVGTRDFYNLSGYKGHPAHQPWIYAFLHATCNSLLFTVLSPTAHENVCFQCSILFRRLTVPRICELRIMPV